MSLFCLSGFSVLLYCSQSHSASSALTVVRTTPGEVRQTTAWPKENVFLPLLCPRNVCDALVHCINYVQPATASALDVGLAVCATMTTYHASRASSDKYHVNQLVLDP